MHSSVFPSIIALFFFFASSSSHPAHLSPPSSLTSRAPSVYCDNAPGTKAGTFLGTRDAPDPIDLADPAHNRFIKPVPPGVTKSPPLKGQQFTWCANQSTVYVEITYEYYISSHNIISLLNSTYISLYEHISSPSGDGVIAYNVPIVYQKEYFGISLEASNAAGHEMTYGVFATAIEALADWMGVWNSGAVLFRVWDGENQVGAGSVG